MRILRVVLAITVFVLSLSFSVDEIVAKSPSVSAKGAVLIDVNSGRILYEKNPNQQMKIASLTKIMTAIVAIENGNLEDMVTTSDNAFGVEGSSIYLKKGEQLSLENMLYGLMLRSGNDAATAIAEHIGGSIEGFVYLMNEKAMYLGLTNTHFANPHGLDHEQHYSSPRDMAVLTAYALKNPTFKKIVSIKVKSAPMEGQTWNRKWYNKNKMLFKYEWADGVKTGYTRAAKRCLASSATKNGIQLAAITLNANDDWNDHIRMLEYGFNNYKQVELMKDKQIILDANDDVEYMVNGSFIYPLKAGEEELINTKVIIDGKNNENGKIQIYLDKAYIGSVQIKKSTRK